MVTHDPDLNDACAVPFCLGEQERTEEMGNPLVDKGEASPGRPREMGVEACAKDTERERGFPTKRTRAASFRTRAVAEPAL